jgi:hypothetical protein
MSRPFLLGKPSDKSTIRQFSPLRGATVYKQQFRLLTSRPDNPCTCGNLAGLGTALHHSESTH